MTRRLIATALAVVATGGPNNKAALWGAYEYTPNKDVVRAPMTLSTLPMAVDQLTWNFADMTDAGGKLVIMWDKVSASVPFKVGS